MNKVRCPICDAAMPGSWQEYPQYPFCSPRCKTIDLGRWLSEKYTVADDRDEDRSSDRPGDQ
jgi:endogenous inhibitor of DNA gyrase (YacG/DUF329 family)